MSFGKSIFPVGFNKKTPRRTYSSKEIMEFRHVNNVGRH
jgi:hypothetical protein